MKLWPSLLVADAWATKSLQPGATNQGANRNPQTSGGGRIPSTNIQVGPLQNLQDSQENKQTWNQNTGQISDSGDNDTREKGNLEPGYWCDQMDEVGGTDNGNKDAGTTVKHTLDTDEWILQVGRHAQNLGRSSDRNEASGRQEGFGDRIIGGQNAQAHAWSYIAYFYGCGATLIAQNWAVTAAHCCTIPAWYFKDKDLCFGRDFKTASSNSQDSVSLEQCSGISAIIQHPEYDRTVTVMNDICLLKLKSNVNYNKHVQPSCLPRQGDSLPDSLVVTEEDNMPINPSTNKPQQKIKCYVAGWGYRQENKWTSLPDILQDAQVHLFHNETCEEAYTETDPATGEITEYYRREAMSCFGHEEGGIDACQGDSGGPLICLEASDFLEGHLNPVLRGVVSWGEGCARQGKPGVYARVSQFTDWIHETIRTHAGDTNLPECGQVKSAYTFDENVRHVCGANTCRLICLGNGLVPSVDEIKCENKKLSPQPTKHRRIGCSRSPSMYSHKCGAIDAIIEFDDLEKMNVYCSASKCTISAKNEYHGTCEPSTTLVKCTGDEFFYKYTKIRCEPPKTTTKCGPVLLAFPKLAEQGITAECKGAFCTMVKSNVAQIIPAKVKCSGGRWKEADNSVIHDSFAFDFSIMTFDSLPQDEFCGPQQYSLVAATAKYYQPHPIESALMNFGNVQKPRIMCTTRGKTNWCSFYCPRLDGNIKKTGRGWKCHSKKGWLPTVYNGKVWCHHTYSQDDTYKLAKETKSLQMN